MEDLIKMDELGGKPTIFGNPQIQTKIQKNSADSNFETKIFLRFSKISASALPKAFQKIEKMSSNQLLIPSHFPPTGLVLCGCRE